MLAWRYVYIQMMSSSSPPSRSIDRSHIPNKNKVLFACLKRRSHRTSTSNVCLISLFLLPPSQRNVFDLIKLTKVITSDRSIDRASFVWKWQPWRSLLSNRINCCRILSSVFHRHLWHWRLLIDHGRKDFCDAYQWRSVEYTEAGV